MNDTSLTSSRSHSSKRRETEEERAIRKEKERKARENETKEEREIRKEKERKRDEQKSTASSGQEKRKETEEERRVRKEKEASGMRRETEEERASRKEKERREKGKETEDDRRVRKEKERKERGIETEEERRKRKEKNSNGRKERSKTEQGADEDDFKPNKKEKESKGSRPTVKEECAEIKMEEEIGMKEEPRDESEDDIPLARRKTPEKQDDGNDSDVPLAKRKKVSKKRKATEIKEEDDDDDFVKKPLKKKPKIEHDADSEDFKPEKKSKRGGAKAGKGKAKQNEKDSKGKVEEKDADKPELTNEQIIEEKIEKKEEAIAEAEKQLKAAKKAFKSGEEKNEEVVEKKKKAVERLQEQLEKLKKEKEEEKNVWKWWEEDKKDKNDDGTKWKFLEHKGPLLAPEYMPLPPEVRFRYDGKVMALSELTEEVCTFYGRMLDHDYTTKEVFNKNFMKGWRKVMTEEERDKIRDLSKCDFSEINDHFKKVSEERKARGKDEKKEEKDKNAKIQDEYGVCTLDGHQEKIGNYRVEPPGLFRGRGEHPKQGMVKKRLEPEDIIINCSKDSKFPEPPAGHKWKEVKHDNSVTWLASWTENIQGQIKYVMLNPSSKLKGEKDMEKYEKARELKSCIDGIRKNYEGDFKHNEMRIRQRAVALYFIDKLALRAGNEKDEDQADTVGCCSLRVEHVQLLPEKNGKEFVIEFDFLGKDSIQYLNSVPVEKRVWKNIQLFKKDKKPSDDLFDRLTTTTLNTYLSTLMPELTAKVFRTYNASFVLQEQLRELTEEDDNVVSKMLSYNRANREVAVLCNHQRAVPKTHDKSMANLEEKIEKKGEAIAEAEKELKAVKKAFKSGEEKNKEVVEKRKKAVERLLEQLEKLEIQRTDKDENKTIALGTSKLNYLDPRISVAWSKKHDVPIEKVYNKTQRQKFMWAINMAGPDYVF